MVTELISLKSAALPLGLPSKPEVVLLRAWHRTKLCFLHEEATAQNLSAADIVKRDAALDTLLDLHGSILDQGGGYWIKLEAWRVEISAEVPHGIRYSLSLHEPSGQRVLGYDNAHAARQSKFKYAGRILAFDHKHRHASDKGVPYEFKDAQQLLEDFFADVDRVLLEMKKP